MSELDDPRARLAAAQAELTRALAGGGDSFPDGFDAARLAATRRALAAKRARSVARAWPALFRALGEDAFRERFAAYARANPLPRDGGPLADGRAFARHLHRAGDLPDDGCLEALAVDLRYRATDTGLVPRRGAAAALVLCAARLSRGLVLAARLPGLGERRLAIPWIGRKLNHPGRT